MQIFASTAKSEPTAGIKTAPSVAGPEAEHNDPVSKFSSPPIFRKAACACGGGCLACQPHSNLKVSQPNDAAEIEADQIADRVMRMSVNDAKPHRELSNTSNTIHRKCDACDEAEEEVAEEPVMRKEAFASAAATPPPDDTPPAIKNAISSDGQPLDLQTRSFFQPKLGADLGKVRVHTNSWAANSARSVNALAYTVGQNIFFGDGQYNPGSATGRALLAHELVHTIQQSTGNVPGRIQRQPSQPADSDAELRREMVNMAARWLAGMAVQVETMRQSAAIALATTTGSAAAPRAFHRILNQEILGRLLNNAISVFEAQRSDNPLVNFPVESPEQTALGEGYARAIEQFGLAIDEARVNAANLAPDVHDAEEGAYARNHLRWLEANPSAPLAAGIRSTFTQTELDISTRRHQQVTAEFSNLAATLHTYNLAGNGAQKLREILQTASYQLVRDAASGAIRAEADTSFGATIQPVLDELNGIEWALSQAISRLQRAETRTRAFASDPVANAADGNTLQAHFSTRDPGYATLLADRFGRMARELRGEGALAVHARNPNDPSCGAGSIGGGLSITAAHAEPNHFYFCGNVTIGDDNVVSTLIHETAHAVIPSFGAQSALTATSDTPRDRSYADERIYLRLSTEEALDNAESYSFYVDALLGIQVTRPSPPSDAITGCADTDTVSDAIARATYRIRLGAMWADQTMSALRGQPIPQFAIDVIQNGFPGADEARTRQIMGHLRELSSRLQYYLPVVCRTDTDREARAGGLVYGPSSRAAAGGLTATSITYPGDTLRICPAWFQAAVALREDSLTSILVLRYRSVVPVADVAGIVTLVRLVQEQAHPSVAGRTLQQHQAADAPPPQPTP